MNIFNMRRWSSRCFRANESISIDNKQTNNQRYFQYSLKPTLMSCFYSTTTTQTTKIDQNPSTDTNHTILQQTEQPVSSCKAGTVMKGLNIYAGKADPVALKDEEYPDWLWDCLEPAKKEFTQEEMLTPAYLRFLSKKKIKENALKKNY